MNTSRSGRPVRNAIEQANPCRARDGPRSGRWRSAPDRADQTDASRPQPTHTNPWCRPWTRLPAPLPRRAEQHQGGDDHRPATNPSLRKLASSISNSHTEISHFRRSAQRRFFFSPGPSLPRLPDNSPASGSNATDRRPSPTRHPRWQTPPWCRAKGPDHSPTGWAPPFPTLIVVASVPNSMARAKAERSSGGLFKGSGPCGGPRLTGQLYVI